MLLYDFYVQNIEILKEFLLKDDLFLLFNELQSSFFGHYWGIGLRQTGYWDSRSSMATLAQLSHGLYCASFIEQIIDLYLYPIGLWK